MNNVNIIGRLTRDPELRHTQSGEAVVNFSVSLNDGFGNKEKTCYFEITAWRKLAESVNQYCKKGKQVGITGRLVQDTWDKDGVKQSMVKIVARDVQFLDSSPKSKSETDGNTNYNRSFSGWKATNVAVPEDDDIPF